MKPSLQIGAPFIFLWIVTFIVVFSDALTYPAIPYLVREFLFEELAVVATLGFLSSAFNLTKIAANILGAYLGDIISRDILVFTALILLPPSFALLLFARSHLWILESYILFGIFYGILMPPLNAMVANTTGREDKGAVFAVFNLSWIVSQIIAPALGGILSSTVFLRFPLILSLILSFAVLALFVIFRGLLRGISSPSRAEDEEKEDSGFPAKTLFLLCSVQLLSGLSSGVLMVVTTAFLVYVICVSPMEIGLAYSLSWGIATAISQFPGGKLSDKFGSKPVIVASILMGAPLLIFLSFSRTLTQYMLVSATAFFLWNLSSPAFSALVATLMGRQRWSRGFGLTSAFFSVGSAIGPVIGSLSWATFKPNYIVPFSISAIFLLLTAPFIAAIKERKTATENR